PVGIQHSHVARPELQVLILENRFVDDPDGRATFIRSVYVLAPYDEWWKVPRVEIGYPIGVFLEFKVEQRNESVSQSVPPKDPVYLVSQRASSREKGREGPQRRLESSHVECGAETLPGDVADCNANTIVIELNVVDKVAPDLVRRTRVEPDVPT